MGREDSVQLSSADLERFFEKQLSEWQLAHDNFEALRQVETRSFDAADFQVRVQFNPTRIRSTAARVDAASLGKRPCFLCPENRPEAQRALDFGPDYRILVNPYPIFREHFTVPSTVHRDQAIYGRFADMLELARRFESQTVFYNGPKCGASAPDHAHFQMVLRRAMPIEQEVATHISEAVYQREDVQVYLLRNYWRGGVLIRARSAASADSFFRTLYTEMDSNSGTEEPMMNILCWYEQGEWSICVILRRKHRPDCFFSEGADHLLVSPASVDLGGVIIVPHREDFERITLDRIREIYEEVCWTDDAVEELVKRIK